MMMDTVKIFISYSHEDKELRKKPEAHLGALRRQNYINIWHDSNIAAGSEQEGEINKYLESADIILLLISATFMNSDDYCYVEMKRALERHEREGTYVIPVLIRPYPWKNTSLAQFGILPKSHVPVTESPDPEEAFCDIAKELRYFVENLSINKWRERGDELYHQGKYKDALLFYEKILGLKSGLAASIDIGNVLNDLQEYEEALHAYDTHSRVAQADRSPLKTKNNIDVHLYREALQVYEQTFQQTVPQKLDSLWLGMAQEDIPNTTSQSSLERLNQAIQRSPTNPFLYQLKGNVLFMLEQYRED